MRNAGLEEAQAGIKIAGRNISNLRYADYSTLMAESEEELKSLLMNMKEESEKVGLKLSVQKTKIRASGTITSCCQTSVCSSVLSHHNKDLGWRTLKPVAGHSFQVLDRPCYTLRSRTDHVLALRRISVTALFHLDKSRKIHLPGMRACRLKDVKRRAHRRERERTLWLLFLYVFFSPWACPKQLGLSRECWSPHSGPRTFLWPSFGLSSRLFPSLSFSHWHFGLLFSILST